MHRVVVTGASGFVGQHLFNELYKRGYKVIGLDRITNTEKPIYYCDITSPDLEDFLEKNDAVVHLAAVATFGGCDNNPKVALNVNVSGVMNVIDACIKKKVGRLIFSSSGAVYAPNNSTIPIKEDYKREPPSFYGLTKKMGEDLIMAYGKQLSYIILRYGFIYGKNKPWGAIGNFVKLLKENKQPTIFGGAQQVDFVYIKDIVEGTIQAIETQYNNLTLNLSYGRGVGLEYAYNVCRSALGKDIEPVKKPLRPFDNLWSIFDIYQARRFLGYNPTYHIEYGIEDMIK